jgi:hypothetical protein
LFLFDWIERYSEAASRFVVLHIHLALVLEDRRLDLVDVLLIANRNFDNFVSHYLMFIMRPGQRRSRYDAIDELGHVYTLLEERFKDVAVGALA